MQASTGRTETTEQVIAETVTGNTLSHFESVGEFHDTFGHPHRKDLYETCFQDEPNLVPFRISLMREELNEFKDALKQGDLVEMADALCDLSYVINGAGQCLGINLDVLLADLGMSIDTPGDLNRTVNKNIITDEPDIIANGVKELESFLSEFCGSVETQELQEMGEYLVKLLDATYRFGHALNFDMDSMFREVHRSNMTKVCHNIEDAKESIKRYESEGRYAEPTMRIKGPYYVIFDKKTSKILKNYRWETPDLKQFM